MDIEAEQPRVLNLLEGVSSRVEGRSHRLGLSVTGEGSDKGFKVSFRAEVSRFRVVRVVGSGFALNRTSGSQGRGWPAEHLKPKL